MQLSDLPRCPHCKKKLTQVFADENAGPEPKIVTCPDCGGSFDAQQSFERDVEAFAQEESQRIQRRFDEISRKFRK